MAHLGVGQQKIDNMTFKQPGFSQHSGVSPAKAKGDKDKIKKGETKNTHSINNKKYKTSTYEDRSNKKGESQQDVLNKANKGVKTQTSAVNKHYDDPRYGKELSENEYNDLIKSKKKATSLYTQATDRFVHVSDSLNTVNKNYPKIKNKKRK